MQKSGIDTAVCACGTALTPDQVKLLSEYAEEVVLCYDSDEAGQKATARSLELFKDSPLKVRVLQIPGAKDPDEYIKKFGADRFRALLDGTGNAMDFRMGQIRKKYDLKQDKDRLEYIRETLELLAERISPTEREVYAGRLAEETNISKTAILAQLEDVTRRNNYRRRKKRETELLHSGVADNIKIPYQAGGQRALGVAAAEQMLASALVREPSFIAPVMQRLNLENIVMPDMKEAIGAMYACTQQGVEVSMSVLGQRLSDQTMAELSRLVAQYHDVTPTWQDVEMYLERIARSTPKSVSAAKMDNTEIERYLQTLRDRKGALPSDETEE